MKITLDGREYDVDVRDDTVVVDGRTFQVAVRGNGLTRVATVDGRAIRVDLDEDSRDGDRIANVDGRLWRVRLSGSASSPTRPQSEQSIAAPAGGRRSSTPGAVVAQMAGRVLRVEVQPGDTVEVNDLLLILEAMKMENEIRAPRAGTVKSVAVAVGDRVNGGDALVELES